MLFFLYNLLHSIVNIQLRPLKIIFAKTLVFAAPLKVLFTAVQLLMWLFGHSLCQKPKINLIFSFHVFEVFKLDQIIFDKAQLEITLHEGLEFYHWDCAKSMLHRC